MGSRGERTPLLPAYEHPTSLYQSKPRRPLPPIDQKSINQSISRANCQPDSGSDSDELTPTLLHTVRSHSDVQSIKQSINHYNNSYLYDMNYDRTPSPVPSLDHSTDESPGEQSSLFDSPFATINQSIKQSINPLVFIRIFLVTSMVGSLIARRALLIQVNDKYGLYCLFCMTSLIISFAHSLIDQSIKQSTNLCSSLAQLPWMKLIGISFLDCLTGYALFLCLVAVPPYVSIVMSVIAMSLLSMNQLNYQSNNQSTSKSMFYWGVGSIACALVILLGDCVNQTINQSNNPIVLIGTAGLALTSVLTVVSNQLKQNVLYDQLIDCSVFSVALAMLTLFVAMCLSPLALKGEHYINLSINQSITQSFIPPFFNQTNNYTSSSTGGMPSSTGLTNLTSAYDPSINQTANSLSDQSFPATSFVSMSFVEPYSFNLTHGTSSFPNFGSVWLNSGQLLIAQPWLLLIMFVWLICDQATKRFNLSNNQSIDDPTRQSSILLSISVFLACASLLVLPIWLTQSTNQAWIILSVAFLTSVGVVMMHMNHQDPSNEVDIWETVWSPMQKAIEEEERAYQSAHALQQTIHRGYKLPSPNHQPINQTNNQSKVTQPVGRPRVF